MQNSNARSTRAQALPQFCLDMIAAVPQHGEGVHAWLFKVARQLHAHRSAEDIVSLLAASCHGCGRHVPEREIREAVRDAQVVAWRPSGDSKQIHEPAKPKWPALNKDARAKAISTAGIEGLADLWDASPIPCTWDSTDAEFFADELFPGNPLLCVGVSNSDFRTAPREDFRGQLGQLALVVPSPMAALTGKTKEGKESAHSLSNTGPRHFLVTEFDSGTTDEQAALIWHLRQYAPTLVLVLSSGGKSLHAWWLCKGVSEEAALRFHRYAVSIAADPATWTRSQFVRLPQGWRADKQKRQEVAFFDPSPLGRRLA